MKNFILISIFTLSVFLGKAQCIRIYVAEKIKEVEIPVERRKFEITINDTMKLNLTSGNNGLLGRVSLPSGKYNVKLTSPDYADALMNDVVVEESRSTNITMIVATPTAPVKIEEKQPADKKKLEKK
jgi:hypothetical protein